MPGNTTRFTSVLECSELTIMHDIMHVIKKLNDSNFVEAGLAKLIKTLS